MECSCTEDCPPLSWDGRDDGQQTWVAERSTALTRSSRIETAISRGGDKGVLSVAKYFSSDSSTDRIVGYEPTDGGSNPSPSILGCLTKRGNCRFAKGLWRFKSVAPSTLSWATRTLMAVIRWWRLGRRPRTGPPQRRFVSTLPFVWLGWGCKSGCPSKDCPCCYPCPSLSFRIKLTWTPSLSTTVTSFFHFGFRKEVGTATRKHTPATSARFPSKGRNEVT